MRAVVQRAAEAAVRVDGQVVAAIGRPGLVVLVGVTHADTPSTGAELAGKVWRLRILRDEQSASDIGAPLLVISQFTLDGDARKGRRPTWAAAAPAAVAQPLYEAFCASLEALGGEVVRGVFGADMAVSLVNDGPVTVLLER